MDLERVGIIPNPFSGKDIRRLVACGTVSSNEHKINLVLRMLQGLRMTGVSEVVIMPDNFGIGLQAKDDFFKTNQSAMNVTFLDMPIMGNGEDTLRAASMMREMAVGCIITLGGDGTNRLVAKACGETPILPISTGTNNVFPFNVESTVAGMAAGFFTMGLTDPEQSLSRRKRLDVVQGDELIDIALIDAVVVKTKAIGARAVWNVEQITQIVQTCGTLSDIGLSSIGGSLHHVTPSEDRGISVDVGGGDGLVMAPIAPGLFKEVPVKSSRTIGIGEEVPVRTVPSILALDGERELKVRSGDPVSIRLTGSAIRVLEVHEVMKQATEMGWLVKRRRK